jgi:sarcosine oxidase
LGVRVGVVGAGVVGLAAARELARAGHEVRCYEADVPMAARSGGRTRIFRVAHAVPGLVEWAMHARREWQEWSQAAGVPLVGGEGAVISGDVDGLVAAMAAAGAPYRVLDHPPPGLPAADPAGPFLVDGQGGVIQAAATGRYLIGSLGGALRRAAVTAIDLRGNAAAIAAGAESWVCDSVLIAAGAATPRLAAQVGIDVPGTLVHHARFTFPLRDRQAVPPCWLDRAGAWRSGFTSYGHLAGPGWWAMGSPLPVEQARWELGREAVTEASRQVVTRYAAEYVTGAVPTVADSLYCDLIAGRGDGISAARSGPVLAVWGNNLFKFAPRLGAVVARAAADLAVPVTPDALRPAG